MEVHVFPLLKKPESTQEHSKKTGNALFLFLHYYQLSTVLKLMEYNTSLSKKLQC